MLVIVKSSQMSFDAYNSAQTLLTFKMTELLLSDNKMIYKVYISLYNS